MFPPSSLMKTNYSTCHWWRNKSYVCNTVLPIILGSKGCLTIMYFMILLLGYFYELVFSTFVLDSNLQSERKESRQEDWYFLIVTSMKLMWNRYFKQACIHLRQMSHQYNPGATINLSIRVLWVIIWQHKLVVTWTPHFFWLYLLPQLTFVHSVCKWVSFPLVLICTWNLLHNLSHPPTHPLSQPEHKLAFVA